MNAFVLKLFGKTSLFFRSALTAYAEEFNVPNYARVTDAFSPRKLFRSPFRSGKRSISTLAVWTRDQKFLSWPD